MPSIITDYFISLSMIAIILFSFSFSLGFYYTNYFNSSVIAMSETIERINDAIQRVFMRIGSSEEIQLILPEGFWIKFENNTIYFYPNIYINLKDPNKIIEKINKGEIIYKDIIFNNELINRNSKIYIICININLIKIMLLQ